jgi:hypothetical protein
VGLMLRMAPNLIRAVVVGASVNPAADRSDNDRARSDNNSPWGDDYSPWGDNDGACGDTTRPVHTGSADHGVRFRRQGYEGFPRAEEG